MAATSATIRILAADKTPLASAVVPVEHVDGTFTLQSGPGTDHLFGQWRTGFAVEILVRNERGTRQTRYVCEEPAFAEDESTITLEAKVSP